MSSLKQFVVYKLLIGERSYIGSTSNFRKRLRQHKNNCFDSNNPNYNTPLYKYIRENNLDFDDIEHEILEEVENIFDNDKENEKNARMREQYYIDRERKNNGGNIINNRNAYTSEQERKQRIAVYKAKYYQNKERRAVLHAEWYKKNKDKLNKKIDCPCGGKTTVGNKAQHERTKKHQDYLISKEK